MSTDVTAADNSRALGEVLGEIDGDYRAMLARLEPHRDDPALAPFIARMERSQDAINQALDALADPAAKDPVHVRTALGDLDEVLDDDRRLGRDLWSGEDGQRLNALLHRPECRAVAEFYGGNTPERGNQVARREDQRKRLRALDGMSLTRAAHGEVGDGIDAGRARSAEHLDATLLQDLDPAIAAIERTLSDIRTDDGDLDGDLRREMQQLASQNVRLSEENARLRRDVTVQDTFIAHLRRVIDDAGLSGEVAKTTAHAQAEGLAGGLPADLDMDNPQIRALLERISALEQRNTENERALARLAGTHVPAPPTRPDPTAIHPEGPWQMHPEAIDGIRRAAQTMAGTHRGFFRRNRGKIMAGYVAVAAALAPGAALGAAVIAAPAAGVAWAGLRGWEEIKTSHEVKWSAERAKVLAHRLHNTPGLDDEARAALEAQLAHAVEVMAFSWGRRTALRKRSLRARFRALRADVAVRRAMRRGSVDERTLRQVAETDLFNGEARDVAEGFYAHVGLDPSEIGSLTPGRVDEILEDALDRRPSHEVRADHDAHPEPDASSHDLDHD